MSCAWGWACLGKRIKQLMSKTKLIIFSKLQYDKPTRRRKIHNTTTNLFISRPQKYYVGKQTDTFLNKKRLTKDNSPCSWSCYLKSLATQRESSCYTEWKNTALITKHIMYRLIQIPIPPSVQNDSNLNRQYVFILATLSLVDLAFISFKINMIFLLLIMENHHRNNHNTK